MKDYSFFRLRDLLNNLRLKKTACFLRRACFRLFYYFRAMIYLDVFTDSVQFMNKYSPSNAT